MEHERLNIDQTLYETALRTEGFFAEEEALLLMRAVAQAAAEAWFLEVGSYRGRSTLFALSVLRPSQQWVVVDKFVTAAKYSGHSYLLLQSSLGQRNVTILPMALSDAWRHLDGRRFQVAFIDGDHSFLGFAQDLAIAVALSDVGGTVLCHDVSEFFPGVSVTVEAMLRAGILAERERTGSLVRYEILFRPQWLWNPTAVVPDNQA